MIETLVFGIMLWILIAIALIMKLIDKIHKANNFSDFSTDKPPHGDLILVITSEGNLRAIVYNKNRSLPFVIKLWKSAKSESDKEVWFILSNSSKEENI